MGAEAVDNLTSVELIRPAGILNLKLQSFISVIVLFIVWQALSSFQIASLPTPWKTITTFTALVLHGDPFFEWTLQQFVWASLKIVLRAWLLSLLLAVPLGICMGRFTFAEHTLSPVLEVLRPIPPLAWIPISYIIFAGTAAPTNWVQVFVVFIGSFFPILLTTVVAVKTVEPYYMDVARSIGATPAQMLSKVIMPSILPSIVTGARIGLGVGWMCIVAAEFVGGKRGIGFYIWTAYTIGGRAPEILAGMASIGLVGYLMNKSLLFLQKRLAPWH